MFATFRTGPFREIESQPHSLRSQCRHAGACSSACRAHQAPASSGGTRCRRFSRAGSSKSVRTPNSTAPRPAWCCGGANVRTALQVRAVLLHSGSRSTLLVPHRNRSLGDLELQGDVCVPPTISEQVGLSPSRNAKIGSMSAVGADSEKPMRTDAAWHMHGSGGVKRICGSSCASLVVMCRGASKSSTKRLMRRSWRKR